MEPEVKAKSNHNAYRFVVSFIFGAVIYHLMLFVAWQNTDKGRRLDRNQFTTCLRLMNIRNVIVQYQHNTNNPTTSEAGFGVIADLQSEEKDDWSRPFIFKQEGTNWTVTSYGRDGKPGGVGADSDLVVRTEVDHSYPKTLPLAFGQFLFDASAARIRWACAFCSMLVFALTFYTVRAPSRGRLFALVIQIVATVVAAVVVGSVIAALHIPTGH